MIKDRDQGIGYLLLAKVYSFIESGKVYPDSIY